MAFAVTSYRRHLQELLHLALPLVIAQLAQISMGFVDTVMLGRLSPEALAAGALGNAVYFPVTIVAIGVLNAVGPMVSQAYGAGKREAIQQAVQQGLFLAVAIALPLIILFWHMEPFFLRIGQRPDIAHEAQRYLRAISGGVLANLSLAVLRQFVEGISRPRPVTVITLIGVGLNIVLDYLLMFGKAGFPALGVMGTGLATAIVYWIMCLLMISYIRLSPATQRYHVLLSWHTPQLSYLRELLRVGWPIGLLFGVEAGLFATTTLLMGRMGAEALAAHQVVLQTAATTFMVPLGIGIATSVRVGQYVGTHRLPDARRAGFVGILAGASFMSLMALFLWTFPEVILSLYLPGQAGTSVYTLALQLLSVAAVFQIVDGIQVTASGALRGLKDTFVPMLIGVFSYWGIGLATAYMMAFVLSLGPIGLWWGLVAGLATAAFLLTARFHLRTRGYALYTLPSTL